MFRRLAHPTRSSHGDRIPALLAIGAVGALALASCGSDEASDDATDGATEEAISEAADTDDEIGDQSVVAEDAVDESDDAATQSGAGSITLTVEDGTVYEFTVVTSCDTSATDPSGFPLTNGYDLGGRTADGEFSFTAGRAGFDDENAIFVGALEGDFDDEGKNSKMIYTLRGDGDDLTADGASVSGTVEAAPIGPTRPHGDATTITVDATC